MRASEQHDWTTDGLEVAAALRPGDAASPTVRSLVRTRRRQLALIVLCAVITGLGVLQVLSSPSDSFPMIGAGLIALGAINGAVSAAGLWRVVAARRMHDADLLIRARGRAEDPVFDQTNGVVDLGEESASPDPNAEADRARRLSSLNAAGIAAGSGTH